jgi:hypothetical protein
MRARVRQAALAVALALAAAGCGDPNVTEDFRSVVATGGRETVQVPARDLAETMARTGFTRQEILDHGPAIRNALAVQGGAEFRRDGAVAALFSVMDGSLYVVSRRGGTYVHDLSG